MVSQLVSCPLPLDFPAHLCHTYSMTHSRAQLIDALLAEHVELAHDDASLLHPDDYLDHLHSLTLDQLIAETCTDDTFTLDEFMFAYS